MLIRTPSNAVLLPNFLDRSDRRFFLCNGYVHVSSTMIFTSIGAFVLGLINIISWWCATEPNVEAAMNGVPKAFVLVIGAFIASSGVLGFLAVQLESTMCAYLFVLANELMSVAATCTSISFIIWSTHHGSNTTITWLVVLTGITALISMSNVFIGALLQKYNMRSKSQKLPVIYCPEELMARLDESET